MLNARINYISGFIHWFHKILKVKDSQITRPVSFLDRGENLATDWLPPSFHTANSNQWEDNPKLLFLQSYKCSPSEYTSFLFICLSFLFIVYILREFEKLISPLSVTVEIYLFFTDAKLLKDLIKYQWIDSSYKEIALK